MIHYLEFIETKQNIYDQTMEIYKRKMGYIKKRLKRVWWFIYENYFLKNTCKTIK